jgi:bifunctional UDP-N-acetylglucosamine pyrophosphorylase/glucosamine-1-phosphate N-acetyltransferase
MKETEKLAIVILAAGKGTRMRQSIAKVLAKTSEKRLIEHVLDQAAALQADKTIIVTGHQSAEVSEVVNSYSKNLILETTCCLQEQQRGTGDAVKAALPALSGFKGAILVLYGDVPLVRNTTLKELLQIHQNQKSTVTLLTIKGYLENSYGRIIRNNKFEVEEIIEFKDCSQEQKCIDETNSGIMLIDSAFLEPALNKIEPNNSQGEYYLTDLVALAVKEGQRVSASITFDRVETQGVNTIADLEIINQELLKRRILELQTNGVVFENQASVFIDSQVKIGSGTRIGPSVSIFGSSEIGENVRIDGCAYIKNSKIGAASELKIGVRIEDSEIDQHCSIGPFAHLRPESKLAENVKIGNFVEIKKSSIGTDSKVSHLSYIGDAELEDHVNIGAGTITCNYDGKKKSKTIIRSGAFTGSNSSLVAPLEIGKNAYIGAGSVITKNVEENDLALTRAALTIKKGWGKR